MVTLKALTQTLNPSIYNRGLFSFKILKLKTEQEVLPCFEPCLYNKLNGLEPGTSAALVRFSAEQAGELIAEVGGARPALLAGYRASSYPRSAATATVFKSDSSARCAHDHYNHPKVRDHW
jgi:hypothetical protein